MDTPKALAARPGELASFLRTLARHYEGPASEKIGAAADYLDRLSAPDVGVGLTRYSFDSTTFMGHASAVMGEDPNGQWVRFEDVAPLLAAARAVPADVVLETTAEERRAWSRLEQAIAARCSRDIDTLTAALAASTAREKAKDAEIAGLRGALEPFAQYARAVGKGRSDDSLIIGITGNGVEAAIYMGDCRRAAALTPDAGTARSEDEEE